MRRVLMSLVAVALGLAVVLAFLLPNVSASADLALELSKAVIALITAVLITGILSFLLTQYSAERTRRDERLKVLTSALQELKSGYERVQVARFHLSAHLTGLTLSREISAISEARGRLHRVQRERWVIGTDIDRDVQRMLDYLTAITDEYSSNYRTVDEAALLEERLRKRVIEGLEEYPSQIASLPFGQFPQLFRLIDEGHWTEDDFQNAYSSAKRRLHEWLDEADQGRKGH